MWHRIGTSKAQDIWAAMDLYSLGKCGCKQAEYIIYKRKVIMCLSCVCLVSDYVCMAGDRGVAQDRYKVGTRYLLAISDNQERKYNFISYNLQNKRAFQCHNLLPLRV